MAQNGDFDLSSSLAASNNGESGKLDAQQAEGENSGPEDAVKSTKRRNKKNNKKKKKSGVKFQAERLETLFERRPPVQQLLRAELIKNIMVWTELAIPSPNQPYPRNCHTCTLVGRRLYLLGGYNVPETVCHPIVLDIDLSTWDRPSLRSLPGYMPRHRYAHSAVAFGPFLIIFGGYASDWSNEVWVLDTRNQADILGLGTSAAVMNPMLCGLPPGFGQLPASSCQSPTPPPGANDENTWYFPAIQGSDYPPSRAAHSAVLVDQCMIVFGGNNGLGLFNDTWALDMSRLPIEWVKGETVGTPPSPRSGHTAVVYNGQMCVFGGGEGWGAECFNDLHVLKIFGNARSLMWVRPAFTGTPPAPRTGHSACVIGARMFVFGGGDARRCLNELHILDIDTMTWSRPSDTGALPHPRSGHSSCSIGAYMVVFGGSTPEGRCFNDIHVLDTAFNYYDVSSTSAVSHSTETLSTVGDALNQALSSSVASHLLSRPAQPPGIVASLADGEGTDEEHAGAGRAERGGNGQLGATMDSGDGSTKASGSFTLARRHDSWSSNKGPVNTAMLASALGSVPGGNSSGGLQANQPPLPAQPPRSPTPHRDGRPTMSSRSKNPSATPSSLPAPTDAQSLYSYLRSELLRQRQEDEMRFASLQHQLDEWKMQRTQQRESLLKVIDGFQSPDASQTANQQLAPLSSPASLVRHHYPAARDTLIEHAASVVPQSSSAG